MVLKIGLIVLLSFCVVCSSLSSTEIEDSREVSVSETEAVAQAPRKKTRKFEGACTNEQLRKIMHDEMSEDVAESKRSLNVAVGKTLGGSWAIICAKCAFSYLAHTQEYCIHHRFNSTCLVFRDN